MTKNPDNMYLFEECPRCGLGPLYLDRRAAANIGVCAECLNEIGEEQFNEIVEMSNG